MNYFQSLKFINLFGFLQHTKVGLQLNFSLLNLKYVYDSRTPFKEMYMYNARIVAIHLKKITSLE